MARLPRPAQAALDLVRPLVDRIFPQGALILSVLTLGYFAMGLVRNRLLAQAFGAGPELDAYNAAFRIPEIALDVLVAAGLTAPFVPIYTSLRRDGEPPATEFARTVLTLAVLVMSVVALVVAVLAPWTVQFVAPGFDDATRATYVELVRINAITPILFAASITVGEVLVANRRFLFYALAPILYTGGIVIGTALFADGLGIRAPALGAVAGAAAHLAIRVIGLRSTSFRPGIRFAVRTRAFREFVRLMLPRMVSHPIDPVMYLFFTNLASTLGAGSVAALNFASDFQVVPVSLVGVSFSLAVFPALSAAFAAGDRPGFVAILRRNVVTIAGLTILASLVLWLAGGVLIDLLLRGGAFDADDVRLTATVLAAFALSIPFDSLSYPLSRALYATHNTLLQVLASLFGFLVVVASASWLAPQVGIVAIPLGLAAGSALKVAILAIVLVPRIRRIGQGSPREVGRRDGDA